MASIRGLFTAFAACVIVTTATAQAASGSVTSTVLPTPSAAPGYTVKRMARGLETPRGIIFDSTDRLLTVQRGIGVVGLTFSNTTNGTSQPTSKTVIADDTLNHGIELSSDGNTLYASSTESVFSWAYDPMTGANTSTPTILVSNMTTSDHTTRTLLLSRKAPGILFVARGSTSNIDPLAEDESTGHSQVKAFNITNMTDTYDFNRDGLLLGWGLRNDVGIAEEPTMGGIYTVENSVDQMTRLGKDIHATNPGEELNYLGTMMNNTSPNQGSNFGYPECYSAWDVSVIPQNKGLKVGMQFAIGADQAPTNDSFCQNDRTPPRLVFESHMAPLDIKFDTAGTTAWVTFHGSWYIARLPCLAEDKLTLTGTEPRKSRPAINSRPFLSAMANRPHRARAILATLTS